MDIQLKYQYSTCNITFEKGRVFKNVTKVSNGYNTDIWVRSLEYYDGNSWWTGGKGPHPNWKIGYNEVYTQVFIPETEAELCEKI